MRVLLHDWTLCQHFNGLKGVTGINVSKSDFLYKTLVSVKKCLKKHIVLDLH